MRRRCGTNFNGKRFLSITSGEYMTTDHPGPTGTFPDDWSVSLGVAVEQPHVPSAEIIVPADDCLVGLTPSEVLPNLEQTIDQLTTATDLFDVPAALDFDSTT